ncbi:conserved oligomeric Golgi complex subunit 2 isoform X3 [Rhagoletis pomonella]|uniref:conserved oligomeric Golgi complex subunit 2 isoform X3 n=1 Tax=Rhagoletis pomonella TaxID=28610 RepID=UPI00177F967B|nr:conserved oligomeric Golgi complex subunit 2 isoform X3 [Rhagoletis pomonella]
MKDQTTYLPTNSHGFTNVEGNKNSTLLCFDKNDFMMGNFSVDEFLHKNRNAPSLEQLRDDLGIYLKDLRASMIDLINEDYADFVSLSANLVGLDQSIANIENPVLQFRKEVDNIRFCVKECAAAVSDNLKKKQKLREEKRNLQCHQKVQEAINKLSRLLEHQLKEKLNPFDVERAALELIQLQFNRQFCLEILNDEQKKNIERLEKEVLAKLRISFSDALKGCSSKCSDLLERCLRIYITLDACQIAEQVFREDIVAPYMSTIISEHCLQNSPQGLSGIYGKALNFISLYMTDLLRLTHYTDKLCGFNFLINSFWVDVEMRLETYMPSIFAPGNSEVFYVKYKCTRDFLSKIEELLANDGAVKSFREHKQTISFQARWNLPVYFQICFQEIAGEFESILDPLLHSVSLSPKEVVADSTFQLATFDSASKAIDRCWMEGVYLKEIFPKFLKLNLQILLRLSRWVQDAIQLITNGDLKNALVDILVFESGIENVRQVKDLPRLYRKTNREIPSKPSAYVDQILRPLKSFQKQKCSQMGKMVAFQILKRVCSKITKEYYVEVTDVLTSVQKTEESLRRLRNLKSGTSNAFTTGATAMSDDDKIRLQLHVDVITWTGELAKLGLMPSDVENLFNLNDIVEASSKIKGRNDNE